MDKAIFKEYMDACELIRETEADIRRLNKRKKEIVQDCVKGSNPNWPYEPRHFLIEGTECTSSQEFQIRCEEKLLEERKANAEKIKNEVQALMNTIPIRMQRIIRMKYFEGCSWDEIACHMGRNASADSVRKELNRFLEEK